MRTGLKIWPTPGERSKHGGSITISSARTAAWHIARLKNLRDSGRHRRRGSIRMESFLKLGALPPDPRDLSLFSRQNGRYLLPNLRAALAAAPCLFRPLNRSLGSHPCVALSRPAQVASVCNTQSRRSRGKAADVTTNSERF